MIKPNIVVSWPIHMDYPWFRNHITGNRFRFSKVLIGWSDNKAGESVIPFVMNNFPHVQGNIAPQQYDDWRQNAIRDIVDTQLDTEWTLFLEQDFLVTDNFWNTVLYESNYKFSEYEYPNFIYYQEGERIHPAFALVKTNKIKATVCDFAANPPFYDHFGKFFAELDKICIKKSLKSLGLKERVDYYHMAGLTQNYHCFWRGESFYKPEEFFSYNYYCLQLGIPIHPRILETMNTIENKYKYGDRNSFIKTFFP